MSDDTVIVQSEPLHSDSTRSPDAQLAIPGRPFPGALTNPTAGARVLLDPLSGTTNAGTDTLLPFRKRVHHLLIQNNSAAPIYVDFDVPASLGSIVVASGLLLSVDVPCDELHVYTPTAVAYNASNVVGSIVIRGWA